MSPRIAVLDSHVIDQIAAGEVVERPASAIKELIENALDAGATQISIEIENGGASLIRVSDDGSGMGRDDATLSVQRHATSKIVDVSDLSSIRTFGFRGEALASLASVSRFRLHTRPRETQSGTKISIDGGSAPVIEDTGCAPGTTVEVRDLFFNVPARKKFLKSQGTESALITEHAEVVALAQARLRLTLSRDGRLIREYLPVSKWGERARTVFGESLTEIEEERNGVRLRAVLGPPEKSRSGASKLFLYVNERPVRDRGLARAVAFAYGSVLPPGRYPIGAVFLELDPSEVDINVHPQKLEVRFAKASSLYDAVTRMLAPKLGTGSWSGLLSLRSNDFWENRVSGQDSHFERPRPSSEPAPYPPMDRESGDSWGLVAEPVTGTYNALGEHDAAPEQEQKSLLPAQGFFGSLRVLSQVRKLFLVCEGTDALHVIDQHAADERINYHRLRAQYENRAVATQRLLFPEKVECSATEAAIVEEHQDTIQRLGLDCGLIGPSTVAIHAIPAVLRRGSPERLLRDIVGEISHEGSRAFGDAIDTAIATMACHGSIRRGDALSPEECVSLLKALDEIDTFSGHCPHGRPIVHSIPFADLEHRLGR